METALIIATLFAACATVLSLIFIVPKKKRETLPKFFQILHDVFNFKQLYIEHILKAIYIFASISLILAGFFGMLASFSLSPYDAVESALVCLLYMLLGLIIIRIVYELFMLIILLVKNVMEINQKIPSSTSKSDTETPINNDATPCEHDNPEETSFYNHLQ